MININIEKIEFCADNLTIMINGKYNEHCININLSSLELAKLFETDLKIVEEATNKFGSNELEKNLKEIREVVEKYPNIKRTDNKIILKDVKIKKKANGSIELISEDDICGWEGEDIINIEGFLNLPF